MEIDVFGLPSPWRDDDAEYSSLVPAQSDTVRMQYFDEDEHVYKYLRSMEPVRAFIQAVERPFVETGSIERKRFTADEWANVEVFRVQVARLAQTARAFHAKVTINHVGFIQEELPGGTDYAPLLTGATEEYPHLHTLKAAVPGKIFYDVCRGTDFPNMFIGSPPLESRLMPWLVEKLGLYGVLHWSFTAWAEQPYQDLQFRDWRFGDSFFVYPRSFEHLIFSSRYQWLFQGIRGDEVMQILKSPAKRREVQAALDAMFRFEHHKAIYSSALTDMQTVCSLQEDDYDRLW